MNADGVVDKSENKYITDTINVYSSILDFDSPEELRAEAKKIETSEIETWKAQLSPLVKWHLLKDMIALAMCDLEYSNVEREMIKNTAKELNISEELCNAMTVSLQVIMDESIKLQNMIADGVVG